MRLIYSLSSLLFVLVILGIYLPPLSDCLNEADKSINIQNPESLSSSSQGQDTHKNENGNKLYHLYELKEQLLEYGGKVVGVVENEVNKLVGMFGIVEGSSWMNSIRNAGGKMLEKLGSLGGLTVAKSSTAGVAGKGNNSANKVKTGGMKQNAEEALSVVFTNQSPHRVSLFWDNDEEWHRVIDSLAPGDSATMSTYVGHAFIFTREGTRSQLSEPIIISASQSEYILPPNAVDIDVSCADRYARRCPQYKAAGECLQNPGWMIVNCPKSCDACELLDPAKRCDPAFLNVSAENVWKPGDLHNMFERIVSDYTKQYDIEVLAKPPSGPWVLQFNNFLTDEEVDTLLKWGDKLGYQRSTDTGQPNERGEVTKIFSQSRTSTNAWCTKGCEDDPVVRQVSDRIVEITRIPYNNYEQFQLLKYEIGQYYKTHHDMGPAEDGRAGGVRILTFFLYLSDVEEGGETDFPKLGMKVSPKKGRAILWPSVKNESPMEQDPSTYHAALPVIKGQKYAANHWIHSHNFKVANLWGCTGAFD